MMRPPALPPLQPSMRRTRPTPRRSASTLAVLAALVTASGVIPASAVEARIGPASATLAAHDLPPGVAWVAASTDAEVDAAFARARAEKKPVFLYWGATWCPPCNQVKATIFTRAAFVERSRAFVPVYVDGDRPGAQKVGARFAVSGYPTMVLFTPDGRELVRLPGEVEPERYQEVLSLALVAKRPAKAVLADALGGGKALTAAEWRLLAFHAWDVDPDLGAAATLPKTLASLAARAEASSTAEPAVATRIRLKALAARDGTQGVAPAAERARLVAVLADPRAARGQADVLVNYAGELVGDASAPGTPERQALLAGYDAALARLSADGTLSRADRIGASIARVDLARLDEAPVRKGEPEPAPRLDPRLVADVRDLAVRLDRETSDRYERQAVVTAAAHLLQRAGLGTQSDAMLEANLSRSHSPYYLMSGLAGNAKKRGDTAAALDWSGRAYATSVGPATRLQWGASHLGTRLDLAPGDEPPIEALVAELWRDAFPAQAADDAHARSARSLERIGERLKGWNQAGAHAAAMRRIEASVDAVCAAGNRSAAERKRCRAPLDGKAAGASSA